MSGSVYLLDLHQLTTNHTHQVGSKAEKLGRLKQLGLRVPRGFSIVSDCYLQHLRDHRIDLHLGHLVDADVDTVRDHLLSLRAAICASPLTAELQQAIATAYSGEVVAVRSSATAEDLPEASFAGQYDTVLNVTSLEACYDAVKRCWASLWTERAYHYREQNGIDHQQVRMAVIVQQQVDADMAGVAFSIDPVLGSRLRITIEACRGLGEDLVSGRVTPERWIWRKQNLKLLETEPVAGTCLSRRVAKRLAKHMKRLEREFGCPQDVEWAVQDGRLFFLQSRPITNLPAPKTWEEKQVWTNVNLGEVVPDVCTPITASLLEQLLNTLFSPMFALLGADCRRAPVAGCVAGRLYFNLTTCFATCYPFWLALGCSPDTDEWAVQMMGGHQADLDIPEEDFPDMGFSWGRFVGLIPANLWAVWRCRPAKATRLLEAFVQKSDYLRQQDLAACDTPELAALFCRSIAESESQWNLLFLVGRAWSMGLLDKINRDWLKEKDNDVLHRLFAAQGGMADTEAGLHLWRLAALARQVGSTEQAVLSGDAWAVVQHAVDPQFRQAWESFMAEHGHHSRGELEFYNVRWCEQPDYILQMIRSYLQSYDQVDPLQRHDQLIIEREQLERQCAARLRNPLKRWLFRIALNQARQLARDRENWKNQAVRWIAALRRILLELGIRLSEQGLLPTVEDVFFLTLDEIEPVAQGMADFDVAARITQRRQEYEWNLAQNPIPVVAGPFVPDKHNQRPVETDGSELAGLGVSPGIVTGPARVILRADDHETVAPGEILVAPFTDPAWTPYFVPAVGVVMDLGGALSHGSIIAREYGLPAVVNVGCATQVIKTGQQIEVDGRRGTVRLINGPL